MIWIFGIRDSAVSSNPNPGIPHILEAEFLQRTEQGDQKTRNISAIEICRVKH
jgi:hypothetical protein